MKVISFILFTFLQLTNAEEVDVFLAAGQSNAKATWADSIESTLNRLRPDKETVVVHSFHSGSWLQGWWNVTPQQNYRDNLAALESAFSALRTAGKEPVLKGVFWFQGEGDSGSYPTMDLYKERFKSYLAQLETDMGVSDIKAMIVAIDGNSDPSYDTPANLAGRTRAQVEYMRNIHFELGSELDGFAVDSRDYQRGDAWHLPTAELVVLGQLMAEKYYLEYWLPEHQITPSSTKIVDGKVNVSFTAPAGIANWKTFQSNDLSTWTLMLRSEATISETSDGNYISESAYQEDLTSIFYRISIP